MSVWSGLDCNDIENRDDVYYCEVFDKNEYDQVWTIAGAFMLISLGITLSNFTQFATFMNTLNSAIAKMKRGEEVSEAEMQDAMLDLDNIGGYTVSQYIVLQALMVLLYFIAKCLLITDKSLKDVNKTYDEGKWHDWVNTHNVLIMYIFTCSNSMSNNMLKTVRQVISTGEGERLHTLARISCIIFVADLIGSFIMICIKYGYILLFLYYVAVAMLCGLMLGFTVCCWAPLIFGVSFVLQTIFKQFACGNEKCIELFNLLASALALNALFYFIMILVLIFMWLFIGGPEADRVVLYDHSNELDIFWILVVAAIYGFLVMVGGFIRARTVI